MRALRTVLFHVASWLFRPMLWWIRWRTAPAEPAAELGIDPSRPVCYVIPARSLADRFVLEQVCRKAGLPSSHRARLDLPTPDKPAFVYLPANADAGRAIDEFEGLLGRALADPDYDVQIVPVSVFWGRDPGKETSLLRLMFSDSVTAGAIRKFFIMLANGREVYVHFGRPLELRSFMARSRDAQSGLRKLARVLNVHFLRTRSVVLGPSLLRRGVLIRQLLARPAVRAAIRAEAEASGRSADEVARYARKCAEEIAADYSSATINFLDRVLTYVWNRIYAGIDVHGLERVKEWAATHEIVYVPSHRSHADYLLLSYVLYHGGLVPPHIAAGVNLNLPIVGPILRRGGAFFMRRRFAGDRVYTAVFRAYVDALIQRGYSISFYPEGTRSRTGRLLQPKTGLMAMIAESALRQRTRKVALVPMFITYDKVWEINSYLKELRGGRKQRESVQGLIKATRILGRKYGKPYVNFGEPIRLQDFADRALADWREAMGSELEPRRPEGFPEMVKGLSEECMRRINGAAVAGPVALTASAVLASPRHAVGEAELVHQLDTLARMLVAQPYSPDMHVPLTDGRQIVDWSAPIAGLARVAHPWGDVVIAPERAAVAMTYYRNNIQHLLAVPSLIAVYFRTRYQIPRQELVEGACSIYPLLRAELFLRWDPEDCAKVFERWIDTLLAHGLLRSDDEGRLTRPSAGDPAFEVLAMLSRVLGESLERSSMAILMLERARRRGERVASDRFVEDCGQLAARLALLTGRSAPEYFDKTLFRGYLEALQRTGMLEADDEGQLAVREQLGQMARRTLDLLPVDAQQTILQAIMRGDEG